MPERAPSPPIPRRVGEGQEKRAGRASADPRLLSRMMGAEKRALELARGRHDILVLEDLLRVGWSKDAVRRRVDSGWLTRMHPGIFSVGEPTDLGRIQAGLLACGPESMAAAQSAAALDDLLPYPAAVFVSGPRDGPRPKAVEISRPRTPPDWYLRHGLRTTMVPETLLRLAATAAYGEALDATNQAFVLRKTSTPQLARFLETHRGARGASVLREIVEGPRTRSHLERLFFRLLRDARLPLPLANVWVNGHLVDFWRPDHQLVVETDGWASHGTRGQFERDRSRDLEHLVHGVRSARITYLQLTREPHALAARLGALLLR